MALSARRGGTPDPVREHLSEVRRALMRLHKTLIDSERGVFEASRGPVTNTQLLGALLEDPFFQWMRPFSQLMAAMDDALFGDEPVTAEGALGFVRQAQALVMPTDESAPDAARYAYVRSTDPTVLLAHTELTRRVAAALLAYEDGAA